MCHTFLIPSRLSVIPDLFAFAFHLSLLLVHLAGYQFHAAVILSKSLLRRLYDDEYNRVRERKLTGFSLRTLPVFTFLAGVYFPCLLIMGMDEELLFYSTMMACPP